MGFYRFDHMDKEFATPKHSTAFGELLTGESIEVGRLRYKAGEGAETHSHPQEQILVVMSGRVRVKLGDETREVGPGEAYHALPNVPHSLSAIDDSEVLSCKNIVAGAGHRI